MPAPLSEGKCYAPPKPKPKPFKRNRRYRRRRIEEQHPITITVQGSYLHFKDPRARIPPKKKPRRGCILDFTMRSRNRLVALLNKVDWATVSQSKMITLTYPDDFAACSFEQRTIHRTLFLREMEVRSKRLYSTIWRTEWEDRQSGKWVGFLAPHHHILFLQANYVCKYLVDDVWNFVLGNVGPSSNWVTNLTGPEAGLLYIAKFMYIAKDVRSSLGIVPYLDSDARIGRSWGVTRRSNIPWSEEQVVTNLSTWQLEEFRKAAGELLPHYDHKAGGGCRIFGRQRIIKILRQIGVAI